MTRKSLYIAWGALIGLSIGSTLLTADAIWAQWPAITGIAVLLLAWQKARIILTCYLGLADAPTWRQGFDFALVVLFLLMLGLYLIPQWA